MFKTNFSGNNKTCGDKKFGGALPPNVPHVGAGLYSVLGAIFWNNGLL